MLTQKEMLRIIAAATTLHVQGVKPAEWKVIKETDESLWIGLACSSHIQVRQDKVSKLAFLMEASFAETGFEILAFAQLCGEVMFRDMAAPLFEGWMSRESATRACRVLLAMYAAAAVGQSELATPEIAEVAMQMAKNAGDDPFEGDDDLISAALDFVMEKSTL